MGSDIRENRKQMLYQEKKTWVKSIFVLEIGMNGLASNQMKKSYKKSFGRVLVVVKIFVEVIRSWTWISCVLSVLSRSIKIPVGFIILLRHLELARKELIVCLVLWCCSWGFSGEEGHVRGNDLGSSSSRPREAASSGKQLSS
jgi:hypothetical protein